MRHQMESEPQRPNSVTYLFVGMLLQAINPAVANTVTELFLLPVQYVLQFHPKNEKKSVTPLKTYKFTNMPPI